MFTRVDPATGQLELEMRVALICQKNLPLACPAYIGAVCQPLTCKERP